MANSGQSLQERSPSAGLSLGFAPLSESKIEMLVPLLNRQTLKRIASETGLISHAVGFSAQRDPNILHIWFSLAALRSRGNERPHIDVSQV
jgi:hypothetical protein